MIKEMKTEKIDYEIGYYQARELLRDDPSVLAAIVNSFDVVDPERKRALAIADKVYLEERGR